MNLGILFCLILAHLAADFPLQFRKIINLRNSSIKKKSLMGNCLHAGIHFLISLIFLIYHWSCISVLMVLAISLIHGIIDYIKSILIVRHNALRNSVSLFLTDQLLHLVSIVMVWGFFNNLLTEATGIKSFMQELASSIEKSISKVTYAQKVMLAFALIIMGLWGVGIFIRLVFNSMALKRGKAGVNNQPQEIKIKEGSYDGGFIIGVLERIFIILSTALNMPMVIGFILTAKSVARLKKFDDEFFVEMFIIGSFISFISAIVIGYLIRVLDIIPQLI